MNADDISARPRILFVSREPVHHTRHGSTTAVNNLLRLLSAYGAEVEVLVTLAASRSPRLWFRRAFALPEGCRVRVPGYLRIGSWYLRPWVILPWMRALARLLSRGRVLSWLARGMQRSSRGRLFTGSWDLTEPTRGERKSVRRAIAAVKPQTVIGNYACWGPVLAGLAGVHRAILMHDLLSEHVLQFQRAGLRLDCNPISPEMEQSWLNGADTLIAAQRSEAAAVRPQVHGTVLTQPMRMYARTSQADPEPLRCLFVGSNSPPNVQGLRWLLNDVWPLVLLAEPGAVLAVAGTVCERMEVKARGVHLLGRLESLAAEHGRAAVCLVPLRVGSGIKIKLLEALSFGKAAVSTTVGVQGLEDWMGGVVEVEDEPGPFAGAIVRLLRHPEMRRSREAAALALVRRHFAAGSVDESALMSRLLHPAVAGANRSLPV